MNNFHVISGTVLILLYELLIHPLFHRLIPNVKITSKICVGALLHLCRLILLLTLVTYTRHTVIGGDNLSNTTLECLFYEPPGFLEAHLDKRWNILVDFINNLGDIMFFIGFLEYLCAQIPYSMKGVAAGICFLSVGLFLPLSSTVHLIFENVSFTWGTGIISCGFWFFVTKISLLVAAFIVYIIYILKCYKKRKREDVLPNEHIFAERYYSRTT